MARWVAALLLAAALGCAARRAPAPPPPPPPPARTTVAVTVDPIDISWRDPARAADMGPSEPGFTFCCGEGRYKLEIDCSDMLKRCYERSSSGRWAATYGRHCKRALGEACYLDDCDARCQ